ncbi:MAG: two pore domain potassium channel family protein [Proteobacteria bacterium]|nr:two pore domain potassium channel family protein [Pseudomonadota bacterium]
MKRLLKINAYWQILAAQAVLIMLTAFLEEYFFFYVLFALVMLDIFWWVIASVITRRGLRLIAAAAGLSATVAGGFAYHPSLGESPLFLLYLVSSFGFALFALIAVMAMIKAVFSSKQVTADTIVGSICIYVMIGMMFAFIYAGITVIDPAAFNIEGAGAGSIEHLRDFLYFSYVTMATIGFGDIVPTLPLTKMLTVIEGMTGPVYLAIMVARLVGLHMAQSGAKRS